MSAEKGDALTPAEERVLAFVASGVQNKEIAYALGIAEQTVKAHVANMLRKMGVPNRGFLILRAHGIDAGACLAKAHELAAGAR